MFWLKQLSVFWFKYDYFFHNSRLNYFSSWATVRVASLFLVYVKYAFVCYRKCSKQRFNKTIVVKFSNSYENIMKIFVVLQCLIAEIGQLIKDDRLIHKLYHSQLLQGLECAVFTVFFIHPSKKIIIIKVHSRYDLSASSTFAHFIFYILCMPKCAFSVLSHFFCQEESCY